MDQSQQNYLRIVAVVYGPGVNAVRSYFDRCFPPNLLNIQLSNVLRKGLEALKQKKVLSNAQWNILFPANGSACSATFDLALMTLLLRHFHIKKEPKDGYDRLPGEEDQTPAADLARIKCYRNAIAHSKDGTIDDESFKDVWKQLYDVVDRLGSAVLKQQCELLGMADLNMAYKSQCEELSRNITTLKEHVAALDSQQDQLAGDSMQQKTISKENKNMIKEIIDDIKMQEQATRILEERMKIQLDDISKRLNSKQSTIPRNVEAKIVRQIKTWIEDEQSYVIIEAAVDAFDLLKTHSSLTVAGNAGSGKTAFIRHLALRFMSQGYEIVPVIEPKTIVDYYDETIKQVFILDDACGVHTIDGRKRMSWLDYGQIIQTCLLQSGSLLLVSVRLSILNSELFEDLKVLSQNVINLKDKKYALSYINRQDIFQSYFKRDHKKLGITDKSLLMHDSFPLLCRLSCRSFLTVADNKVTLLTKSYNDIKDLDFFFQTPIQVIESEVKAMRIDSPISYCLLVLCLLFNGKLPKLDLSFSNRHKNLFEDCYSVCGLNKGTPIKDLTDIAKNLTDVYLKEVDGTLVFIHDIIMDIVSVCFGEQSPDIILKYADIEVIINRVLLKNINTETTGYKVLIPEYYHVDFFHRLYKEIGKGNAWQIFNHCQLEIQWVQKSLTNYFETKSDDELRYIFFQVEDKQRDHYQKLNLKLMDMWAQALDTKPVKLECHTLLELIVNNAFHWLLGKGLFRIITLLERRVCGEVYKELKADSLCTFIAILGGNLKIYSWILNIKDVGKLWQNLKNIMFRNKQLKGDFQWALMTGQTDIVGYLISKELCPTCINESITPYDMLKIIAKLFRFSVYKVRIILFLSKLVVKLSKLIRKYGRINYNLENLLFYSELACTLFYTEDESFNHLILKKFKSEIEPIVVKLYKHRVEFRCSRFPLPGNIFDDVFGRLEAERTYLALAAIHGHESVTNLLLLKGANPNKIILPSNNVAKLCTTLPIVHAAMYGKLEIVKNLLQYGAQIESTGPKGCTLLMLASSYGHYNVAQFLLDKHIAIDVKNSCHNTALLYASKKGHASIVQLLLEHGAIVNTVCHRSSTPLIEAASGGYFETTEKLLHYNASVNACDNKAMNALIKASMNGHFEIVKLLVTYQAVVNLQTDDNETALTLAAKNGHLNVVSFLMSYSYQCVNDHYTSKEGKVSAFENENRVNFSQLPFFMSHLFQITNESNEVNLAFLNAYRNKHMSVLKLLIENGADVQMKYSESLTLLNEAASKGEYEIVNLLLVNGASVQKRGNFGVSPLLSASSEDHTDIIKLLLKHGSDKNSKTDMLPISLTLLEAIYWIQDNCNKSNFQNLTAFNDHSATALIYAARNETSESLEVLLQDKNININSQTFMGRTALMVACGKQSEDIVDLLLKNKADVNIVSKLGATSLDIASVQNWGNENIINSLLRNGALHSRDLNSFSKSHVHAVYSRNDLDELWLFIRIIVLLFLTKYIPVCQ
ncbi:uncharacterized protein LOC127734835 [Mytilus californianus]|uniref:uncharacterized protein LOC127734835 n=1 Tax=Mytilus californianus TaxID=6549 RepID=UPI002248659A|nr:uncharacterized protein LOC127734835 [Mytilus californianus]